MVIVLMLGYCCSKQLVALCCPKSAFVIGDQGLSYEWPSFLFNWCCYASQRICISSFVILLLQIPLQLIWWQIQIQIQTQIQVQIQIRSENLHQLLCHPRMYRSYSCQQRTDRWSHDSILKGAETELECQGVSVVRERHTVEKSQIDQIDVVNDF